ncbi:pentapeptide repeat-containing protein [Nocardia sp. NPDC052566]|uniref:pentapeptide repeat-containing protein n=1 Tax=Nocardia sp. NPDC052566 TaxID=3364330 RepID=UPI0037C9DFBF
MTGSTGGIEPGDSGNRWEWLRRRPLPVDLGLIVGGSATAGFGIALLSGVPASFSQPLATLLAGAGVLTAGVLAYVTGKRGRDLTDAHHRDDMTRDRESDLRDRYTAIAAQIADDSAAIRQAGVYALTALADDWHRFGEDEERQVCINLLQWYLRVPMAAAEDATERVLSEREIRQTIVGIVAERRRRPSEDPKSWTKTTLSLQHASLPYCAFGRVDLAELNLSRANLTGANLTGAKLTGANLTKADLTGAVLIGVNLGHADLFGANLNGASLTHMLLTGANLHGADLIDTNLTKTSLTYANLNGANLYRADLTDTDLSDAEMIGANLTGATMRDAFLTHGNLSHANLTGADLTGADLTGADLTGANLTDTILSHADLTGVEWERVRYSDATQWPADFIPPPRSA